MISKRSQSIDSSGIRRVFDLAQNIKNPINLSIGQPDFDAPDSLKQKAKEAIDSRKNSYTVTQGIVELRQQIASRYDIDLSNPQNSYDVFVTSGVSGGLMLAYMALLDPGDEVLLPDPFFCMYRDLAKLINAKPVYYDCYPDFKVSVEKIEAAITPQTRAILVNSPANPTGYAISQEELDKVIELARSRDLWLIYDEIYDLYCYDQEPAKAFGKYEKTIVLNGFSKSHGVTGWRVGWTIGPKSVVNEMLKIQQYTFVCAPSIAQWGLLGSLDLDLSSIRSAYRKKRDLIYDGLKDKFKVVKPQGAFYIFPEAPGGSGQSFVEKCIARELLVVPGNVFSTKDSHFRISFASPLETIERGIEVLRSLA